MQAHRLVGQRLHHSQFHHPVRQHPQFPVVVPLRGRTAGQGDEMGLGFIVQLPVPVGLDPVFSAPSSPSSAKRRLMRNTVPSDTSKAWATRDADQPSPVFSRIRARLLTRAELFPARTMCSSRLRSSGVSRTANFSRITPPHNNFFLEVRLPEEFQTQALSFTTSLTQY